MANKVNKIYALLVGINEYHPQSGVSSLKGCVNDIEAIETYLHKRIATDSDRELVVQKLTNNLATRQGIIDGFSQHLSQAQSEDVVLFYYAGHGSYEPVPEVFQHLERDGKIETLVCYDSRTSGVRDLADKELNYLIEQVAKNNPHILIILDSCHSGTATRYPDIIVERQTNTSGNARDLQDFLFDQEWVNYRLSNSYQRPRHVLISACRDFQTAKEHTNSNNQRCGAFSYFLTEALHRTNGNLSYTNLVQDINALITGKVKDQSPQIEAQSDDLIKTFLGGVVGERINYFTLIYDKQTHDNWVINGGILHGIRPTSEGETSLAIFAQGTNLEDLEEVEQAICKAEITQVMTETSKVQLFDEKIKLSPEQAYWAVVSDVPLPNLQVFFKGDKSGKAIALEVFKQTDNKFIREADLEENADYYLEAVNGQFWIKQTADKQPLVAPLPEVSNAKQYTPQDAQTIIKRLEHIARWKNILELKTPPTSQIKAGDVEMELIVSSGDNQYSSKQGISPLLAEYIFENNQFSNPEVKIKVINNSDKDVYFQVLELAGDYEIQVAEFFEEKGSMKLPAKPNQGESIAVGDELECFIPDAYLNNGIRNYDNIYKLIVSNREFDASLLQQEGLDNPPPVNRSTDLSGSFNRLMDSVYTRQSRKKIDKYIDNWMTQEVKVTLIKPPSGVEIKESESTNLLTGVELQSHPSLKGKFSINPLPPSSRNVNSNLIPPIFLQEQTVLLRDGKRQPELYNFNERIRGGNGNLSLLEIVDIENHESVTPQNPIKLLVSNKLFSDEYILPIAYDGEFFLPLGKAKMVNDKTEITIERLPKPTIDSRSLQGSIKILFQKVVYETAGKRLGMNFPYPLLRIANISESGRVQYNVNANEIKTKVASANKILLYIHGIIGDTESLLPSLQWASLADKYDLVLAFDYENLNTTIQENGKLLKQSLEEVGISANHGKQLDIVAHSMGGLVSRVFIEEEGGNQIVNHLIMLGTPNAGSPWPKIQDWAFTALGIGLNQLSTVVWPANIIAGFLALLEANDKASEQMKYQSDFIQSIAKNPDPNVQYTIIAGDRTIRPEALEVVGGNSSKIQRLMRKLFGTTVDQVVNQVFFQQPNDIAVTTESIKSVSSERNPQPIIISPIACDHNSYFTTQAGLDALVKALGDDL
ncbi:MAG: peptidase C14 caspase catalytic subunit p20 [Richelia sp. SL_2_1]|nr:peptidase C14 caspase catalytic subunit p20 [Richelia sp. SL_2_1]